jgi:ABC-type multidrug transport system fused ATPase/permease subunit
MSNNQRDLREANSRMIGYISESIRGIRVTQAFSREKLNTNLFEEHNVKNYQLGIQGSRINGLYLPTIEFIGVLGLVGAMIFGVYLIESSVNSNQVSPITPGELASYLLFINVILFPVRVLVELYSMSISSMASAERIYEIIDLEEDVKNPISPATINLNNIQIEFKDVAFRYKNNSADILKHFNLSIKNNETIALVGATGAGKTTIATLISRFYDVTEGAVLFNGINIKEYNQDELHSHMGIVLQEGYLYSGSILQNLKFRNPNLKDEEIIEFCKQLGTHETIVSLPNTYYTMVGEGGHAVSHGQRQLISLTRALITKPKIMIFDEATSSIDVLTESILTRAIEKMSKSTTTIIIAHRLSTVKNADRILVIGDGGILEEGSYNELIDKNGHFAKLVIH